jgi:hypothetical protein
MVSVGSGRIDEPAKETLMRTTKLANAIAACTLALGCAAVNPAHAQTEGTTAQAQNQNAREDRDFGWIGLFGLAGLMGRKRETHQFDTSRGATNVR